MSEDQLSADASAVCLLAVGYPFISGSRDGWWSVGRDLRRNAAATQKWQIRHEYNYLERACAQGAARRRTLTLKGGAPAIPIALPRSFI